MPLFKMGLRQAWAEAARVREDEFQRVMALPTAAEVAVQLMQAFGSDGPRRGKPLTQHDLIEFLTRQRNFASRGQRAMAYKKLAGPVREAMQVLEHAELVYLNVRTDSPDRWHATSAGMEALAQGQHAIELRVAQRGRRSN
jgi:hypothetical protein